MSPVAEAGSTAALPRSTGSLEYPNGSRTTRTAKPGHGTRPLVYLKVPYFQIVGKKLETVPGLRRAGSGRRKFRLAVMMYIRYPLS